MHRDFSIRRSAFRRVHPVMVRDLDGNIRYWNDAAESVYGWQRRQAEGRSSHQLLCTIFPLPLEEINQELESTGIWKGELIHTLSDGSRVKVLSRWELVSDAIGRKVCVVETNDNFSPLSPRSAYLSRPSTILSRGTHFLERNVYWALIPILIVLGLLELALEFSPGGAVVPLTD